MKKFNKLMCLFLLVGMASFAQERGISNNSGSWLERWTEFYPNKVDYSEPTTILKGDISSDIVLKKTNVYILIGNVFVTNNATLTIEPGTVIVADSNSKATLTITKGAKIMAQGSVTDPIIFTSDKDSKRAGDWGGLFILGNAPTNKLGNIGFLASVYPNLGPQDYAKLSYGGENVADYSGELNYVRIEYAGYSSDSDKTRGALSFAGVGNTTKVSNVMVSYSESMSFNFVGGKLSTEKLVSLKAKGVDYNFNLGAVVELNNSLAVRSPYISSVYESSCIRVNSYLNKEDSNFYDNETNVTVNHVTVLTDSKDIKTDLSMGLIREAVYVGNHTTFKMNNSVISGFSKAVLLGNDIKLNDENLNKIQFVNSYFNNCLGNIFIEDNTNNSDLEHWYGNPYFSNVYSKDDHKDIFIDTFGKRPDYRLRIDNIVADNN